MSTALREAMQDLVTNVAPHVVSEDLARRTRVAGRRRRVHRRLGVVALVIGFAVAIVPVADGLPGVGTLLNGRNYSYRPGDSAVRDRATGHPVRIGHQWFIGTLPDRPGPIAGLVETVKPGSEEPGGWYAIAEDGHRWRLPIEANGADVYPTISFDGRWLGYLVGDRGPYVIHDLVTGVKTAFDQIGSGITAVNTPYVVDGQSPAFWAPDGQHLALSGAPRGTRVRTTLVLSPDGTLISLTNEVGPLVGWVGNYAVLRLPVVGVDLVGTTEPLLARVTQIDGTEVRSVTLRPSSQWQGPLIAEWGGATSPAGTEVVLVTEPASTSEAAAVRRFSLETGTQISDPTPVPDRLTPCGVGWAGSTITVPTIDQATETGTTVYVRANRQEPVAVVEPGLGTRCFIWASSAVEGRGIGGGVFGRSTAWWTWWWREILAGLVVLGATALLGRWLVRSRRRRRWAQPSSVSPETGEPT